MSTDATTSPPAKPERPVTLHPEGTGPVVMETNGVPIKAWVRGVPFEVDAETQLRKIASLPFIHKWVSAMPDVHLGKGATVGSVIATKKAIVPAAVGVDIGCGMIAVRTTLQASQLPDSLNEVRTAIEARVPHGRTNNGGPGDRGAWGDLPDPVARAWSALKPRYDQLAEKHARLGRGNDANHLGTLGTGNHFVEVCLDEADRVWVMLHSGSRGVGGRIGAYFIDRAKEEMRRFFIDLPDADLAYLPEGLPLFDDYVTAVSWAQGFAAENRRIMLESTLAALRSSGLPPFEITDEAINCHHNYVVRERHFGEDVWVTRKGAVRAGAGDMGIIPGSMGAASYIVRGKGNPHAFSSCSHGAGRAMTRTEARRRFTVEDHAKATAHVECRKDEDVIDETPMAYKPIDAVMRAQADLVDVVHTLRQVVCVKG